MTLIQDVIEKEVERIKTKLALDNITFYYSTKNEFVSELLKATTTLEKYPFFFINSTTVDYSNNICSIGEILIATMNDKEFMLSKDRDSQTFNPILIPIYNEFYWDLKTNKIRDIALYKEGKMAIHYFFGTKGLKGYDGNEFPDNVDVISLTNYQIRTYNNCI